MIDQSTTTTKALRAPTRRRSRQKKWILPTALMLPAVIVAIGFLLFSLILLIAISLRDIKLGTLERIMAAPFTFDNYTRILTDPGTWNSLWVATVYTVVTTLVPFVMGFALALLLNEKMPFQRSLRTLALLPWAIPGVTATVAFIWILQPTYGVFNYLLRVTGISDADIDWFGNPETALLAVSIPTIWKSVPFFVLMLLAGLQSISPELYEAARVDGANSVQQFRWVTIPSMTPIIFVALVFSAMHSFREFDFIYASTGGGPLGATETIAVRIFNLAFDRNDFTGSATLGVVTFVIVAIVIVALVGPKRKGSMEDFL